jgi:CMP-N,N'-diacetyllegionaminic acid synthase
MRVLGIVPARAGSKRVPGKNRRDLGGRPLVRWAIDAAVSATALTTVAVSSDDDAILAIAESCGVVALRRPDELANDESPAIDYVRHALDELDDPEAPFDAVAIVQPSSPLTQGDDIDRCVELLGSSGADSTVTVVVVEHALHPVKFKALDGDRLVPYLVAEEGRMAAHQLDEVYVRNGSVYVCRRRTIDAGDLLGADSRAVVMPRERSIDINDELDLEFARFLLER